MSELTGKLFFDLRVKCENCSCKIKLALLGEEYSKHSDSCQVSLDDILESPNDDRALSSIEKRVALSVVSRLVNQSDVGTLQLSTKGRVSATYYSKIKITYNNSQLV